MALQHWGFVYCTAGADPQRDRTVVDTGSSRTVMVGVERPEDAVDVVRELVADGAQLIELCGAFGPVHTGRILDAIDGAVPVGAVGYGPEAVDQLHAIFS